MKIILYFIFLSFYLFSATEPPKECFFPYSYVGDGAESHYTNTQVNHLLCSTEKPQPIYLIDGDGSSTYREIIYTEWEKVGQYSDAPSYCDFKYSSTIEKFNCLCLPNNENPETGECEICPQDLEDLPKMSITKTVFECAVESFNANADRYKAFPVQSGEMEPPYCCYYNVEKERCPEGTAHTSGGVCSEDKDDDGIPDIEDPDIDNDGIPNDSDSTPNGEGGPTVDEDGNCGLHEHKLADNESCSCDVGYHRENILTNTGSCVEEKPEVQCPSVHPDTSLPFQFESTSSSACFDAVSQNAKLGGTMGSELLLDGKYCCYFTPVTEQSSDNGEDDASSNNEDPCTYPESKDGYPFRAKYLSIDICMSDIEEFGAGKGTYTKNDGCTFLACYYFLSTPIEEEEDSILGSDIKTDENSTQADVKTDENGSLISIDLSPISTALKELDISQKEMGNTLNDSINNQGNRLSEKLDILGLDLKSSIGTASGTNHNDLTNLKDGQNGIEDAVRDNTDVLHQDLTDLKDMFEKSKEEGDDASSSVDSALASAKNVLSNGLSSFATTAGDIASIAKGSAPTVSYSGGCKKTVTVLGKTITIDFSSIAGFRPYFQFIFNILLAYLGIKLWIAVGRDIVKYIT